MPKHRNHFYMVTVMIAYMHEGQIRNRYTNIFSQSTEKKITANSINVARETILQQATLKDGISPKDFRDVIFMNWSHLGFMTDDEFHDVEDETKSKEPSPFDS